MPEFGPFTDHIMIAPAYPSAFDNLGFLELGDDLLDRPLGNPHFDGYLPQQYVRVPVQT